ncbi:MAG: hypothetical protein WCH77_03705 [Planctomycetota bacterium]
MDKLLSVEVYVGLCLALVLQTNYRLAAGIGVGEIGLAVFTGVSLLTAINRRREQVAASSDFPRFFVIYVLGGLSLSTAVTMLMGEVHQPGELGEWRDYTAYALSALFIWSLSRHQLNLERCSIAFLVAATLLVSYQYHYGGAEAWYASRFTGGAKNPNQLTLYAVCGLLMAVAFLRSPTLKCAAIAGCTAAGYLTRSDAFLATTAVIVASYVIAVAVPPRFFVPAFACGSGVAAFIWYSYSGVALDFLHQRWATADEGGLRMTLYANGFEAWTHSWWTLLAGNGAGVFSGEFGPFEGMEAHNTPIDTLTIGGVVGFVGLYWVAGRATLRAYANSQPLLFACTAGLLALSCFHFVGRHPIFWFTILVLDSLQRPQPASAAAVPALSDPQRTPDRTALTTAPPLLGGC